MTNLPLSFAFGENPRSRPLIDGRISPEGIDLHPTRSGMQELAWRQAFLEAKDLWLADMVEGERAYLDTGSIVAGAFEGLQKDLYPYGVRANKHMLQTLIQYSFEQGLSDRQVSIEEIFYGPTIDL